MKTTTQILDKKGLALLWETVVKQIIADLPSLDNVVVVGVRCRGDHLASRMVKQIKKLTGKDILLGILDITLYRDDFTEIGPEPVVRKTEIPFDITAKKVILVDDVLYTGRTTRAALDELIDFGRPSCIRLAVLIDRKQRELPIQPDYVGKKVDIKPKEVVTVHLEEMDGEDGVFIDSKSS